MPAAIHDLVVKVAELCNLNCDYCYLYQHADKSFLHRPKVMAVEVFEKLLQRVREYCDRHAPHRVELIFHGGEPTLIGPNRLSDFANRARDTLGDRLAGLGMQTNATLLDEKWIEVIRSQHISVGVSLDGPPEIHDARRRDRQGSGSYEAAVRGVKLLREAGLNHGLLCVISPGISGLPIYRHFRSLGVSDMNFLFPYVTHDTKERFYSGCSRTPVADYLIPIFDEWFTEDNPEVKIRIFWNLIRLINGGKADGDAFGNPRMTYLIVETDGSIHGLDILRVCEDGISETGLNLFEHGFDDLEKGLPLAHRMINEGIPLCAKCRACPESGVCGGGYFPHRYARGSGFNNPSVWCDDILKLLSHIRLRIDNAAIH
jgi:uncharacterized protein